MSLDLFIVYIDNWSLFYNLDFDLLVNIANFLIHEFMLEDFFNVF